MQGGKNNCIGGNSPWRSRALVRQNVVFIIYSLFLQQTPESFAS